jgi:hypothetical protein
VTSSNPDFYRTPRGERALQNLGAIDPNDAVQAAMSGLPAFRDVRKTEYLVLRGVLFSHEEALQVIQVSEDMYNAWISIDDIFNSWATGRSLRQLQYSMGPDVLRARFTRNVFLQMHIDNDLLTKRAFDVESMSEVERKEAAEAAKRYSAPNIAAMMKVLGEGDVESNNTHSGETVVKVYLDGQEVVSVEAKRAASKALIDQFTQRDDVVEGDFEMLQ